jgi:hypothetical protein
MDGTSIECLGNFKDFVLEEKVDYNYGLIRNKAQSKLIRIRWVLGLIFQNKIIWSGKVDRPFHLCGTGTEIILIYFLRTRT